MNKADLDYVNPDVEKQKRKREYLLVLFLLFLFLFLTWFEFKLFSISSSLPFTYSIFFFGLINFNIVLFLLLLYFLFRNIAKTFAFKQTGITSGSLRAKLITSFVAFSFIPTALMFVISVFYINNSFEKWFNQKTMGVLKSSLEISNNYFSHIKQKNFHYAEVLSKKIKTTNNRTQLKTILKEGLATFRVDGVEFYHGVDGRRFNYYTKNIFPDGLLKVDDEFLKKGVFESIDSSQLIPYRDGNLIQVIVPSMFSGENGAVILTSYIPMSLIDKMNEVASVYENFKDTNPLAYPLKSIYLIMLVLMTLTILLFATWFGFYLAKHLSIPLVRLADAAKSIAKGDYQKVDVSVTSPEINQLVSNFNTMSEDLEAYQTKIKKTNFDLQNTLDQLDQSTKYLQVVLENVKTGVVAVNNDSVIITLNTHAELLLNVSAAKYLGKHVSEILSADKAKILESMLRELRRTGRDHVDKEVQMSINGRVVPLQLTLSVLTDENNNEIGRVLVFHDLTVLANAQRAAAWTEVAKRIAHEIKNPLTPIKLSAQRLSRKFSSDINDKAFDDCTSTIIDQVDIIKGLVNEFSLYARLPKPVLKIENLNLCIQDSVNLFRQAHKNVTFTIVEDSSLPSFYFDRHQIQRVFTNLIDNSMAAGIGVDDFKIQVKIKYDQLNSLVKLTVEDNGDGVSNGILSHIFEPYVTTKKQGTGLGLAIVKKTIEDHKGQIIAKRSGSGGLEMIIELPVALTIDTKEKYD